MEWSPQQDRALRDIARWLESGEQQVFRMFGHAGTGKTTLAKHAAQGANSVVYMAPTGKAAYVMRRKGCHGASTVHSSIYHAKDKSSARLKEYEAELAETIHEITSELRTVDYANDEPDYRDAKIQEHVDKSTAVQNLREKIKAERDAQAAPMFTLNLESEVAEADLVVLDEGSMADGRMGEDLLSFGTKVLVLGDPAQLPPVKGAGFFTEDANPDVMLTEVHRQALDNPIIAMATKVRNGERLDFGSYGESCVIKREKLVASTVHASDQLLVGRNATRRTYNNRMRQLAGYEPGLPVNGDKLVCLRNNHDRGLLNGAIYYVEDVGEVSGDQMYLNLRPEDDGAELGVEAHTHYFLGEEDKLGWWERKDAEEFDYGYALTVHKAQGSQWNNVVLFDESYCFRADRWRWLYTGITRAAERITVVDL